MSLYDKYFTIVTLWLVVMAVLVRMQIGVAFILLSTIGIVFLVAFLVKNAKYIKPIKKAKKI